VLACSSVGLPAGGSDRRRSIAVEERMALRILVADDSVTIQKVVELTFSKESFTLLQARSGEEAIRKAKEERPDLILLDLVMPDKNGYEVCAALRAEPMLKAVPIILLTGTFEAFDRDRAVQVGANDFVTKPFESQQLISKVRQQLFGRTMDARPSAAPAAPPRPAAQPAARPVPTPPVAPGPVAPHSTKPAEQPAAPPPPERPAPPTPPRVTPAAASSVAALGILEGPSPSRPEPGQAAVTPSAPVPSVPPAPVKPAPAARGGPMELRLEDLAHLDPRAPVPVTEPLSLEDLLGPVERASIPVPPVELEGLAPASPPAAPTPPATRPPFPGPLPAAPPLEELLPAPPTAPWPIPGTVQLPVEPMGDAPVFDLTAEMAGPTLPMIEVGKGEPPALSVEDLIGAKETTPTPELEPAPLAPEGMRLEGPPPREAAVEPGFDLTAEMGGPTLPMIEVGKGEPPALSVEDLVSESEPAAIEPPQLTLPELEMELPASAPEVLGATPPSLGEVEFGMEPVLETAVPAAEPPMAPLPGLEPVTPSAFESGQPTHEALGESAGAEISAPLPGLETDAFLASAVSEPAPPPAPVSPAASAAPPGVQLEEMAAMRDAVTERVARVLARDLSEKLVERIERIVWEVVPEMAELMIAKEIERIRSMADEKNIS
jgi:CheY-like chemotaxis protein